MRLNNARKMGYIKLVATLVIFENRSSLSLRHNKSIEFCLDVFGNKFINVYCETMKSDAVECVMKKPPECSSRAMHERVCILCQIHDIQKRMSNKYLYYGLKTFKHEQIFTRYCRNAEQTMSNLKENRITTGCFKNT